MPADQSSDKSKKRRIEEAEQPEDGDGEEEQTTDDKYADQSRDLVIISSDNVRFHVQKFYVQAASAVFRDMIEDCASHPAEVRLTDDDIEDASIVRLFLDLACGAELFDIDELDPGDVFGLLDLCNKYDCPAALNTIKLLVSRPFADSASLPRASRFYYACGLDDAETAHRLLPAAARAVWDKPNSPGAADCIENASCLDVTSTSISWLESLPRKYFYALLRATRLRIKRPQGTWQEVADEFKEQIRLHARFSGEIGRIERRTQGVEDGKGVGRLDDGNSGVPGGGEMGELRDRRMEKVEDRAQSRGDLRRYVKEQHLAYHGGEALAV